MLYYLILLNIFIHAASYTSLNEIDTEIDYQDSEAKSTEKVTAEKNTFFKKMRNNLRLNEKKSYIIKQDNDETTDKDLSDKNRTQLKEKYTLTYQNIIVKPKNEDDKSDNCDFKELMEETQKKLDRLSLEYDSMTAEDSNKKEITNCSVLYNDIACKNVTLNSHKIKLKNGLNYIEPFALSVESDKLICSGCQMFYDGDHCVGCYKKIAALETEI